MANDHEIFAIQYRRHVCEADAVPEGLNPAWGLLLIVLASPWSVGHDHRGDPVADIVMIRPGGRARCWRGTMPCGCRSRCSPSIGAWEVGVGAVSLPASGCSAAQPSLQRWCWDEN